MPQVCRVCSHANTKDIENDIVQGVAHAAIGRKYDIHFQSVRYHAENHLPEKLVQAVENKKANHAENILDGIKDLLDRTKDILDTAEENGHNRLALDAIKEARGTYELLSKIAVKLEEYRRQNREEKEDVAEEYVQRGLEVLTTAELKTFIQLQGKIVSADPDYHLSPSSRYIVDSMNTVKAGTSYQEVDRDPESPRTRPSQDKDNQKTPATTGTDDDFDLEFDDLDDISLDEPEWIEKERQKKHKRDLGL